MSERWVSSSGKVHTRRHWWYPGTKDQRAADPDLPIMLCGRRKNLTPVSDDTEITCVTCQRARSSDDQGR
jgi:hypothetical protein